MNNNFLRLRWLGVAAILAITVPIISTVDVGRAQTSNPTTNSSPTMSKPSVSFLRPGKDRATREISLTFKITGVWRYDPVTDRWDASAQAARKIAVSMAKSTSGTQINLGASEVIGENDVGLFYIAWSFAETSGGSIVCAGRVLIPNDIEIEEVAPGKVAIGVPFPDRVTVRAIPDPRLHCIPDAATTIP